MSTPLFDTGTYPVQYVLDTLLMDRSTGRNIIFATDSYAEHGELYTARRHIVKDMFTGSRASFIQPRVLKALEEQVQRTRKKAEVFTPAWVCCLMNDYIDEEWFFRKNVFFHLEGQQWTATKGKIALPTRRHKRWQQYVDSRRLEITCGEAPYLVSRYDMATGEVLPIAQRVGILDRKLRIVNENTETEADWWEWTLRAFHSVYGYEYQGDSLLIARINLLLTFADSVRERWNREPKEEEVEEIAKVISWNLWQMDGLSGTVPVGALGEPEVQTALWLMETGQERTKCKVKNWRQDLNHVFQAFREGGVKGMKFDYIIGNPPYQEETDKISLSNGQLRRKSIFHLFQVSADEIAAEATALIYPAGRWIQRSGRGMKEFGLQQINDPRLAKIIYYPKAKEVFPKSDIGDGISIVVKNQNKIKRGFEYEYRINDECIKTMMDNPGEDTIPLDPRHSQIVSKIERFMKKYGLSSLHDGIYSQKLFAIESDFVEKNPEKVREYTGDEEVDYSHEVKLFTNDRAGKGGRAKWYVTPKSTITAAQGLINKWKVVVSSANAGGQKRDNQLEIFDNHSVFGRSRLALRMFDTKQEAENFYSYIRSYFARFAFLMTDENLGTLGLKVPDLGDYTNNNNLVFYSGGGIDKQLFALSELTDDEVAYLKSVVDNLRKKKSERGGDK